MTLPKEITSVMYGFMHSQVLFAGDESGVFDLLARGEDRTVVELARTLALDVEATGRFLEAAASLGLVERTAPDRFSMRGELRPYLRSDGSSYLGGWLAHLRTITVKSFENLSRALRSGETQLAPSLGVSIEDLFDALYSDPARQAAFADSMWALGFESSVELARAAPLGQTGVLVDVGGGSGSFAIAAALVHPRLCAVVLDLPPMRAHCERKIAEHRVGDRVRFVEGDFFEQDLPEADAYALGYVLSDWSTADGARLLSRLYDRLRLNGHLLVLERLFDTEGPGPISTAMMDLCMLLETQGRHRTADAYVRWLEQVGFRGCDVIRSSGDKHMVIGLKAMSRASG